MCSSPSKQTPIDFTPVELKILNMALVDDNRVQTHYSLTLFNSHYLPTVVQYLRDKLVKHFNEITRDAVLFTERHRVIRKDGAKVNIGIYRINPIYKSGIKDLVDTINNEAQGRN